MNPIIIITAYNPPCNFSDLIAIINNITSIPIIVVDDGSNFPIKLDDGIILLRNIKNLGKGYSLIKAFHYANNRAYTHAVTLDADFQHDPTLLGSFLEIDKDISIVIGARDFNINMPKHRKLSNKITSSMISFICGQRVHDSQCGYRRYKLSHVCSELFIENGFQFETEVLIKLLGKKNYSLQHIKIPTIYDTEKSSINNLLDTLKFVRLIFRTMIST